MEHRWGARIAVNIPIQVRVAHPYLVRSGRLKNLSLSGAFIATEAKLRVLSRIDIILISPLRPRHTSPVIAAFVVRKLGLGHGIEWCDFSPIGIAALWREVTAHSKSSGELEHSVPYARRAFGSRH
jgi:hypothetical protein